MKLRLWLVLGTLILAGLPSAQADIYRWSDDTGTVHYGNRPPANGREIQMVFKEIPSGTSTGPQASEDQGPSAEAVIQEFEDERRREEERAKKAAESNRKPPPTRDELVAREKERLQSKIAQLEQMPLEQFGSQRNKRAQIGFYEYRLQDLMRDPEAYFNNPVQFEGNLPNLEKGASN